MPDADAYRVNVLLNPLRFFAAEMYLSGNGPQPSPEQILQYLCTVNLSPNVEAFMERYKRLSQPDQLQLAMAPVEKEILNKMVFPLHHAKTIALTRNEPPLLR